MFLWNSTELRPKPSSVHRRTKSGSPGLPNDVISNTDWQRRHRTGLRLQHQQLNQVEHLLKVGADHLQGLRARIVHHKVGGRPPEVAERHREPDLESELQLLKCKVKCCLYLFTFLYFLILVGTAF